MSMPICTQCSLECEQGSSYIAVIEQEGELHFRWGCEHHQVGDAAAYLGSQECLEQWLDVQHPIVAERWNVFITRKKVC